MKPEFLNVDLEIVTKRDPSPLARALDGKVHVLHCGPFKGRSHFLALEIFSARPSVEKLLSQFCTLIESLPPDAWQIWKEARRRTFDIGFQSGEARPPLAIRIEPATLNRVAKLGATIAITVYPADVEAGQWSAG